MSDEVTTALTPGERDLWRSTYAASWHQPTTRNGLGFITDEERAMFCARQADRAVLALRKILASAHPDHIAFASQVVS